MELKAWLWIICSTTKLSFCKTRTQGTSSSLLYKTRQQNDEVIDLQLQKKHEVILKDKFSRHWKEETLNWGVGNNPRKCKMTTRQEQKYKSCWHSESEKEIIEEGHKRRSTLFDSKRKRKVTMTTLWLQQKTHGSPINSETIREAENESRQSSSRQKAQRPDQNGARSYKWNECVMTTLPDNEWQKSQTAKRIHDKRHKYDRNIKS